MKNKFLILFIVLDVVLLAIFLCILLIPNQTMSGDDTSASITETETIITDDIFEETEEGIIETDTEYISETTEEPVETEPPVAKLFYYEQFMVPYDSSMVYNENLDSFVFTVANRNIVMGTYSLSFEDDMRSWDTLEGAVDFLHDEEHLHHILFNTVEIKDINSISFAFEEPKVENKTLYNTNTVKGTVVFDGNTHNCITYIVETDTAHIIFLFVEMYEDSNSALLSYYTTIYSELRLLK